MPRTEKELIEELKNQNEKSAKKKEKNLDKLKAEKLDAEIQKIFAEIDNMTEPEPIDFTVAESIFLSELNRGNFLSAIIGGGIGLLIDEKLGNENSTEHLLKEVTKVMSRPVEPSR